MCSGMNEGQIFRLIEVTLQGKDVQERPGWIERGKEQAGKLVFL